MQMTSGFFIGINLCVVTGTRVSQKLNQDMGAVKKRSCRRVMTMIRNHINNLRLLVNMEKITVYFTCSPNRTVHHKSDRTVLIHICSAS